MITLAIFFRYISKCCIVTSGRYGLFGISTFSTNPSPQVRVKKLLCFPLNGSFRTAGRFCAAEYTVHDEPASDNWLLLFRCCCITACFVACAI